MSVGKALRVELCYKIEPTSFTAFNKLIGDLSAQSVAILSGWFDAIRLTTDLNYLEFAKPLRR